MGAKPYCFTLSVTLPEADEDFLKKFSKGLFSWVGFNIEYLEYNADKRLNGNSKFKLKKHIIILICIMDV